MVPIHSLTKSSVTTTPAVHHTSPRRRLQGRERRSRWRQGEEDEEIVAALHVEVVMVYESEPADLCDIWVRTQCTVRGGEIGSVQRAHTGAMASGRCRR